MTLKMRLIVMTMILTVAGCSQTETTIVRTTAQVPVIADETDEPATPLQNRTLRVAELIPFETYDPLIARTSSDFRKIQLAYEGLYRLNAKGEPVPALASRMELSTDSLSYTFTLRDNAYFHNDPSFPTGIGRKVTTNDVVSTFTRMTSRNVPETAASLFAQHIVGFDLHNREMRDLYVSALRQTTGIAGIQRIDSRTIRFVLISPDRYFLHRLASPLAVIYPQESVPVLGQRPVGSGPFRFQSQSGDSLITFVLNSAHPDTGQFELRRVDFRFVQNETRAYRSLAMRQNHVIAEAGPNIILGIPDLNADIANAVRFGHNDRVSISLNPSNDVDLSFSQAAGILRSIWTDSLTAQLFASGYQRVHMATSGGPAKPVSIAYRLTPHIHEDFLSRLMYVNLRRHSSIVLVKGYVTSREVTLFTESVPRTIPESVSVNSNELVRFDVRGYRLNHPSVTGFDLSPYSWWLDLRGVGVTK